jgi:ribonuclease Z
MRKPIITMLGTGSALVSRCFNTCFVLQSLDGTRLLVDTGGGNGILTQLRLAGIDRGDISHLFITHAHTDHILGAIWLIRMTLQRERPRLLHIYSHQRVIGLLNLFCQSLLPKKQTERIPDRIVFHELQDGDRFEVGDMQLQCFDIYSTKEKQFGFKALLPDGQKIVCLGDEPYNEACRSYALNADWLMSEAFCLYADRERFKPYEKHHSTALDAARNAQALATRHLILYHTEEETLDTRKELYTREAKSVYTGPVFVPDDLEVIALE